MAGKCSICLSAFREPVSIPCGHIYCTKCLADHVNTPGNDDTTSSCPTCRALFNTVTPDLTYLPKKYHQYIVPGVRRVYIETSAPDLQKKLAKAEARIRKLERDQEILLEQCEQHMSAAHAHAQGELKARTRVAELKDEVQQITTYAAKSKREYEGGIENIEEDRDIVRSKYEKLKVRYREIAAELAADRSESSSIPRRRKSKSTIDSSDISMPEHPLSSSTNRRLIRPLPRSRVEQTTPLMTRASAVSPPPARSKRPRLSETTRLK